MSGEMKLIMENWKRYEQYHDIFENKEYITELLGIPLPLNESGYVIYSDPLREQIIKEHLLFEGLLKSIGKYIKDKSAPLRDMMAIIYKIMKGDTNLMSAFTTNLNQNIIKPLRQKMLLMLNKVKMRRTFQWIDENVIQPVWQMSGGIRKLINLAGLAVFMRMGLKKLNGLLGKILEKGLDDSGFNDQIKSAIPHVKGWLESTYQKPWAKVKEVVAKLADIDAWLKVIGPIAGGVATVASMLVPATKTLGKHHSELSDEDSAGRRACKARRLASPSTHSPEVIRALGKACQDYRKTQAGQFNRDESYA